MARDVLMERRVAQAGTLQARSTAVDTEAWNARPTQRHKALREGSSSLVESRRCLMKAWCKIFAKIKAVNKYAENLVDELRASVTGPQPRSTALTAQHCRLVTCGDTLACAPGQWRCTRTVTQPSDLVH